MRDLPLGSAVVTVNWIPVEVLSSKTCQDSGAPPWLPRRGAGAAYFAERLRRAV